jgi:hypothetical protein
MTTSRDVTSRRFSEVSALTAVGPGRFEAAADPAWTIAGKPNGGYLLAMLGRAATEVAPHPHVLAASAHYLRAPEPGPVTIAAEMLRTGRSASQVRASLGQEGKTCVEVLLTLGGLSEGQRPFWQEGLPPADGASYEDCERFVPKEGFRPPILEQIELRLDPATRGFATGSPTGRGELKGWLTLPHAEDFDTVSLLYALDAFPPATFDIEATRGWVPTLELTAYVRALPAPGPVRVLHKAQLIQGGFVDEACFVWDCKDQLVASSTQLAGIRLG